MACARVRSMDGTSPALNQTTSQAIYGARGKRKFAFTYDLVLTLMGHTENTVRAGFDFAYLYITSGHTPLSGLPRIPPCWRKLDYPSPVSTARATAASCACSKAQQRARGTG